MARYKHIDTSPRFIAVDLERQLLSGSLEHALNYLIDQSGVSSWLTFAARMDEEGTLHPDPASATPCGQCGQATVGLCRNP